MHTIFWSEKGKGRDKAQDVGVDGDNIRMGLRKRGREFLDWTHLVQDRNSWRFLLNTVMNVPVP
jgi:hypothetical protein